MKKTPLDEAISRILKLRKKHNVSRAYLANEAGVSEVVTRNIDKPEWNPTLKILRKIERAINEHVAEKPQLVNGASNKGMKPARQGKKSLSAHAKTAKLSQNQPKGA